MIKINHFRKYLFIPLLILSSFLLLGCVSDSPNQSNNYVQPTPNLEKNLEIELENLLAKDGIYTDINVDGSVMSVTVDPTGWTSGDLKEFTRLLTLSMHNSVEGSVSVLVYHEKYNIKVAKGQYNNWDGTINVELYLD